MSANQNIYQVQDKIPIVSPASENNTGALIEYDFSIKLADPSMSTAEEISEKNCETARTANACEEEMCSNGSELIFIDRNGVGDFLHNNNLNNNNNQHYQQHDEEPRTYSDGNIVNYKDEIAEKNVDVRTYSYKLVLDSIKFNKKLESGVWQIR